MHLLGLGPQMPEDGRSLLFTIRPFYVPAANADRRALHATTACFGIASLHAFRMTGVNREVHCRPFPRCNEVPPVVPRYVTGIPSMRWPNSSYRSLGTSTSQRPFDSENSWTSHRIGSIAVVLRSAPRSPPRHISAAARSSAP